MTIDVRDTDSERQRRVAEEMLGRAGALCRRRDVDMRTEAIGDTSPAFLSMWVREKAREVCAGLSVAYRVMPSGASHDAQVVNRIGPAGIIFVPSREGLSHVPNEWTSVTQIATGTTVLYESVLALDSA
jgi:allantoate deiminase